MSIASGNTVRVHYVGRLADGTEFDRSPADSPLVFQVGSGQVIPGFERAVTGREQGDAFTVVIPAAEAYGPRNSELLFTVPLAQVPSNIAPEPGMLLHVSTDQGELEVRVHAVDDGGLTLDANHPLAGQDLTFDLIILDVS
ncbi:MAG: peptidylprolyl isomerase [Desulfovibrionaceae bacterium]|nr:peptidylprolyl isomerase [Desulfovibrionaceae bacterium]